MLSINSLSTHYGVIQALKEVCIEVKEGEILSLIGANGAGKTSLLNTISGIIPSTKGQIVFEGEDITRAKATDIVAKGIIHVPEGRRIFSGMSVKENLMIGSYLRNDTEQIQKDLKMVYERFPRLEERLSQDASTLSGGEQQMLAIGRGLMAKPRVLLLDEPSMGLAPLLVREIFSIIEDINKEGTTILLVEQNASQALKIADRGYVLETGSIVLSGTGEELSDNPEVKKAYLGG